jgi:hypothetical protein
MKQRESSCYTVVHTPSPSTLITVCNRETEVSLTCVSLARNSLISRWPTDLRITQRCGLFPIVDEVKE